MMCRVTVTNSGDCVHTLMSCFLSLPDLTSTSPCGMLSDIEYNGESTWRYSLPACSWGAVFHCLLLSTTLYKNSTFCPCVLCETARHTASCTFSHCYGDWHGITVNWQVLLQSNSSFNRINHQIDIFRHVWRVLVCLQVKYCYSSHYYCYPDAYIVRS